MFIHFRMQDMKMNKIVPIVPNTIKIHIEQENSENPL